MGASGGKTKGLPYGKEGRGFCFTPGARVTLGHKPLRRSGFPGGRGAPGPQTRGILILSPPSAKERFFPAPGRAKR